MRISPRDQIFLRYPLALAGNRILLLFIFFHSDILNHEKCRSCKQRNTSKPDAVKSVLQPDKITESHSQVETQKSPSKESCFPALFFPDLFLILIEQISAADRTVCFRLLVENIVELT